VCNSKDWTACEALFSYLQPDSSTDPELTFLLSESRIDYLVARGLYSQAWDDVEKLSVTLKEEGADVLQRISLLIAKADICRRLGRPERGFSVALRAASVAFKAHLKTCLFTAVGLLANILVSSADYHAATRLLSAIIPQVCSLLASTETHGANRSAVFGERRCPRCRDAILAYGRCIHGPCGCRRRIKPCRSPLTSYPREPRGAVH
jgi:hypothetical protein